jgi:hypothetical protein
MHREKWDEKCLSEAGQHFIGLLHGPASKEIYEAG